MLHDTLLIFEGNYPFLSLHCIADNRCLSRCLNWKKFSQDEAYLKSSVEMLSKFFKGSSGVYCNSFDIQDVFMYT